MPGRGHRVYIETKNNRSGNKEFVFTRKRSGSHRHTHKERIVIVDNEAVDTEADDMQSRRPTYTYEAYQALWDENYHLKAKLQNQEALYQSQLQEVYQLRDRVHELQNTNRERRVSFEDFPEVDNHRQRKLNKVLEKNERLSKEYERLSEKYERVSEKYERVSEEKEKVTKENKGLAARVQALLDKLHIANQNSSTWKKRFENAMRAVDDKDNRIEKMRENLNCRIDEVDRLEEENKTLRGRAYY